MEIFAKAKSIWLKNKRDTVNLQVGFRCDFSADIKKNYKLKITGATYYRIYLNGKFEGYGPARAGHGYVRVDEFTLSVENGLNKLAVEVAGYNCSSFYSLPINSFLCAEILENNKVLAYTGKDFYGKTLETMRNRCSYRYSFQRTFTEVWNFNNKAEIYNWMVSDKLEYEKINSFNIQEKFIKRQIHIPKFDIVDTTELVEKGTIVHKPIGELLNVRYVTNISSEFDGYLPSKITESPIEELYGDFKSDISESKPAESIILHKDEYAIFKLPFNNTGFLMNSISVKKDCKLHVFFAEYNCGEGMIFNFIGASQNIVKYNLKQSNMIYHLESFEPYTCQYIGVAVTDGEALVSPPKIREYSYPEYCNTKFKSCDEKLNAIFNAALQTFRQNTVDVFMDCPGRERGGWLCDSYFTSQSEKLFSGKSVVEKAFLENYVMAAEFPNLPQGMIPMVYPGNILVYNSGYIPQWAMWYVIELGEYAKRQKNVNVKKFMPLCYNLLGWFEKYENSDGLLEKMDGWNFVEWSKANEWVLDVNYPTNMLYSKLCAVMGDIFKDNMLIKKAENLKKTIMAQSFDGEFFVDNAIRKENGALELTGNRSEVCQYYAYFFEISDLMDEKFTTLTDTIINIFGSERRSKNIMPEIEYANAFIGNYLRMLILLRMKRFDQVIHDVKGYFAKMADLTGTLWEHDSLANAKNGGSLNHGFASFAGVAITYAIAGISNIAYDKKTVFIDNGFVSDIDYEEIIGTDDGEIIISEKGGVKNLTLPQGWVIK